MNCQEIHVGRFFNIAINANAEDLHHAVELSEEFQHFRNLVREHMREGRLPDLEEKRDYKIYRLRSNKFGAHESIVVSQDDENFVTIELLVNEKTKEKSLGSAVYEGATRKLELCGIVETSGQELFLTGFKTVLKFGSFNKIFNNCQDFCNDYLKNIGFPEQRKLTDPKKVTRCGLDCG